MVIKNSHFYKESLQRKFTIKKEKRGSAECNQQFERFF